MNESRYWGVTSIGIVAAIHLEGIRKTNGQYIIDDSSRAWNHQEKFGLKQVLHLEP